MKEITDEEYELFQKLASVWYHSEPERTGSYFICGHAGEHDDQGLPDAILVCPQMGSNITAIYEKRHVGKSGQSVEVSQESENKRFSIKTFVLR